MSNKMDDAARRRAERRRRIRRKRIITTLLVLIVLSIVVGAVMCFTLLFSVENILVKGSKLYTSEQIVKASEITQENNLLLVSEEKVLEKIRKKLPFVDSIVIEKQLPDSLNIKVTDAKEYAVFKNGNDYYTISKKGYVLKQYSEKPDNVFQFNCKVAKPVLGESIQIKKEQDKENLKVIIECLENKNIPIDYIDITDSLALEAKVCGRFIVNFGTYANLDKKIAHLSGMISGIPQDKTGRINLSMWTSNKTEGSFVEGSVIE